MKEARPTLHKVRSVIRCPVCGVQTSDKVCPFSVSGTHNGKGPTDHRNFLGIYTSSDTNPYWSVVNYGTTSVEGFRLGWTPVELESIFEDARRSVGSQMQPSASYVTAKEMDAKAYISVEHAYGLTKDELFAICAIMAMRSKEFPASGANVDLGFMMLPKYDIPTGLYDKVFFTFADARNTYALATDPGNKRFRAGLCRLLMRWSIPPAFGLDESIYNAIGIPPKVPKLSSVAIPPVHSTPDSARYSEYTRLVNSGEYSGLFSQLYYYELPAAKTPTEVEHVWADILWLMVTFDKPDFFGLPGFIFLPEDRLTRIGFMLAIAAIKFPKSDDFVESPIATNLASLASPYITPSKEVWAAEPEIMWPKDYMLDDTIFAGYTSGIARLGKMWFMEVDTLIELFRRLCGVPGGKLALADVTKLQGGAAEMLNFQHCLRLMAPFINTPSPLPYKARPNYGIMRCEQCKEIYYEPPYPGASCGAFDRIDDTGKPVPGPTGEYRISLEYECQRCSKKGCRELDIMLSPACSSCNSPDTVLVRYRFDRLFLRYWLKCQSCNAESQKDALFDADADRVKFEQKSLSGVVTGTDTGNIKVLGKKGEHGEDMFMLVDKANPSVVKLLEMPYNLKAGLEPDKTTRVTCPYEVEESPAKASECCQDMPSEWEFGDVIKKTAQRQLVRSKGVHDTILVETLTKPDGTTIKRYECKDHKERVLDMVASWTGKLVRGKISIDQFYRKDKMVSFDPADALSKERSEATVEILAKPLSISAVPAVAQSRDELQETLRYYRSSAEPDIPVSESSPPTPGMRYLDYKPDNRLGLDFRHFYTFDIKETTGNITPSDCEDLCKYWENLELMRATMPFERDRKVVRVKHTKKSIRAWEISHSPSHLVPTLSIPFIPTVTPRERIKHTFHREREAKGLTGLVSVHVDASGSMQEPVGFVICPYILGKDECSKCGGDSIWSDDMDFDERVKCQREGLDIPDGTCLKRLNRVDVARRIMAAIVLDAKERADAVMLYRFRKDSRSIVGEPSKDYKQLLEVALHSSEFAPSNGTEFPETLKKQVEDFENAGAMLGIKKAVTIVLTDGDIDDPSKPMLELLQRFGPVYIYVVAKPTTSEAEQIKALPHRLTLRGYDPAKDNEYEVSYVSIKDGGLNLTRDMTSKIKKNLKK